MTKYAEGSKFLLTDTVGNQGEPVTAEYLATVLSPDPYDERGGAWYANHEARAMDALLPGDVLLVVRAKR